VDDELRTTGMGAAEPDELRKLAMPTNLPVRKKGPSDLRNASASIPKFLVIVGVVLLAVVLAQVSSCTMWPETDELSTESVLGPILP
jgi:hypothetical protein